MEFKEEEEKTAKQFNFLGLVGLILSILVPSILIMKNNFKMIIDHLVPGYAFASVGISFPLLSLFFIYLHNKYAKDEDKINWNRYKKKTIKIALPSIVVMIIYFVIMVILSSAE